MANHSSTYPFSLNYNLMLKINNQNWYIVKAPYVDLLYEKGENKLHKAKKIFILQCGFTIHY